MSHPMISSLCFLLPLIILLLPSLISADQNTISQACEQATPKDFCVSFLQASPESQNSDIKGLAFLALKLANQNATDESAQIREYLRRQGNTDPAVQQAISDCGVQYLDATNQIDNAVLALSVGAYSDVDRWVKAAITDIDVCEDGIQKQTSGRAVEVSQKNIFVRQLFNMALSVAHVYAQK
ncbi:cell wall / vacuolar inhibitor of fructosidase 2 [Cornus florida]|uniref:cell wall / vacuolar inhibitor of fructosidase 2 n=1 Tax=Cornus florida TaxID=4283 RepID=UPI0028987285|nr:cell wall / vacuolar inhibitor of fructosidase 2 [Cornus florida]